MTAREEIRDQKRVYVFGHRQQSMSGIMRLVTLNFQQVGNLQSINMQDDPAWSPYVPRVALPPRPAATDTEASGSDANVGW
jgi:hypothetical protein